jgi:hypothetical protein
VLSQVSFSTCPDLQKSTIITSPTLSLRNFY